MHFLIFIFLIFLAPFAFSEEQINQINKNDLLKQNIIKSFKSDKEKKEIKKIDEIINFVNEFDKSNNLKLEIFDKEPIKRINSKKTVKIKLIPEQTKKINLADEKSKSYRQDKIKSPPKKIKEINLSDKSSQSKKFKTPKKFYKIGF